jgi:hypothetical protein
LGEKEIELDLYDKAGALVKMGEHIGMFKKNLQLTGANGEPLFKDMSDDDLDTRIRSLMKIVEEEKAPTINGFAGNQTENNQVGNETKEEDKI